MGDSRLFPRFVTVGKFVFCLTGPYLTGRATIGRLELPPGEGRFVCEPTLPNSFVVRSLLTVVRRVLVVGEVKADVVLAHGRRDERVLGVERLHHEGLDPKGCEGAADRVEHDVDGRRLGVAALVHGVEEVVGLDVRRFLATSLDAYTRSCR